MRGLITILFLVCCLTACKNFDGIVGHENEDYTTHFNYRGERLAPYDNPYFEKKEPVRNIKICTGKTDSTGFQCNK